MSSHTGMAAREARLLEDAERHRVPVAPLSERLPGLTFEDAYAVQRAVVARRLRAGARARGYRVGLNLHAVPARSLAPTPDHGVLVDGMAIGESESIAGADLISPYVEAEIAIEVRATLQGGSVEAEETAAAIGRVAPALGIVDSRIAGWQRAIEDSIADNGSLARYALGPWRDVGELDLGSEQASLGIDGHRLRGRAGAGLGHPLVALAWLVRRLARLGDGLQAGSVVLVGCLAAVLPSPARGCLNASFAALGRVEVKVL